MWPALDVVGVLKVVGVLEAADVVAAEGLVLLLEPPQPATATAIETTAAAAVGQVACIISSLSSAAPKGSRCCGELTPWHQSPHRAEAAAPFS